MTSTSAFAFMEPLLPLPLAAIVLLKVTIVLALVAAATFVLRRRSAALRHLLWSLAIAGIVALPVVTVVSPFKLHLLPASNALTNEHERATSGSLGATGFERDASRDVAPTISAQELDSPAVSAATENVPFGPALFLIWLLGTFVLLARFVAGLLSVRRLVTRAAPISDDSWLALADRAGRARGARAPIDIRVSDDVAMPFAYGLITPTIVLPPSFAEWTPERREAVVMHELAHLGRGDLPMNALSHVARALYWFHPLAWVASHRLRVESERACDDAVLRGGARPSDYAEHLLGIVRSVGNTVPSAALSMARRSDFEGRLLSILEDGVQRNPLSRWRVAAIAAAFVAAMLPLAAMSPTAKAAAMPASQETPDTSVRQKTEPSAAVAALIETLSDVNAAVRLAAVRSLGSLDDPRAIAALAKALREDADPRVREAAAWALGEIDDSRAVPHLLEALKTERVANVREKIVWALGEIDDPSAVPGIAAVVKDPSVAVRRTAVWALGELEDPSAVPVLVGMARDEDAEVRKHVAEALGNLENASALDALMALARDSDAEVRSAAVNALGQLEDPRTLNTLLAALKDSNAEVRSHAAEAIHNIDGLKNAPRALIDALGDVDREVRRNVAHALGGIGDEAAVPALKKATTDADVEVRRAAAEALSEIGGAEAITALMGLLKDQDPEIRRIAAEALGKRR